MELMTHMFVLGAKGSLILTARDIIWPPYAEIFDNTRHIASSITEPKNLCFDWKLREISEIL